MSEQSPDLLAAVNAYLAARDALKDAAITSLSPDDPRFGRYQDALRHMRAVAEGSPQ